MADARYIVEIILQARDNTAEAFASAAGNQEDLKRIQKESAEEAERTSQAYDRMGKSITATSKEIKEAAREQGLSSVAAARQAEKLEQSTRSYERALKDSNATIAQQRVALAQLEKDYKELSGTIGSADAAQIRSSAKRREEAAQTTKANQEAYRVASANIRALEQDEARTHGVRMTRIREFEATRSRSHAQEQARQREREQDEARAAAAQQRRATERQRIEKETVQAAQRLASIDLGTREMDEVSRKLQKLNEDYQKVGGTAANTARIQRDAMQGVLRDLDSHAEKIRRYTQLQEQARQADKRRLDALKEGDKLVEITARLDQGKAVREALELRAEINAILGHIDFQVDADFNPAQIARIEGFKQIMSRDVEFKVKPEVDTSQLQHAQNVLNEVRGSGQRIAQSFNNAGNSLAVFDNVLRGMLSLGITAFLSNLVTLAGAAAGAFLALAGSAAMAGAAIGGALVAGVAQAIPVLGILITAIQRVKAVTDAVQQANLLQQQSGQQQQQQRAQEVQQAEQLRAAQERIKDATERVRESQENLTKARRDAVREVEALTLAQRGNVLTLKEAREEERRAVAEGRAGDLARARLAIDEARLRVREGGQELGQARAGRTPAVESATEQLESSREALDDARRSAAQTRREVAAAGDDITSGANKLNFLMAQLSDAERRLFTAIQRLSRVWKDFSREVSAPLIDSFTGAVNGVVDLLRQPRILNAARGLSSAMATQFDRVFAAFTDNESIEQFIRIADQAKDNLKPLTDIAIDLGEAFMDIAEAAGPALSRIIGWIADATDNFADFMDETRKSGELGDFFDTAADHLKAWIDLLVSIGRIFIAIFGPAGGAQTGLGLIKDLTGAFNDFADAIGTRGTAANTFFRDLFTILKQTIEAFKPVFEAIGDGLADLFGEEAGSGGAGVKAFAAILAEVLIPAFFDFLQYTRRAVIAIGELVENNPLVANLARAAIAFAGGMLLFGRVLPLITPIFSAFNELWKLFVKLFSSGSALRTLLSRPLVGGLAGGWVAAIVAGVVILLAKLGLLDDLWESVKKAFTNAIAAITPAIDDLLESFSELSDAFDEFLGGGGGTILIAIFEGLFVAIEELGGGIGRMLGGAIRILAGFMDVLSGLLTGDFGKMLEGIEKIWSGMVGILINPFVTAFRILDRLLGGALSWIGNALADVVSFIVGWGVDIFLYLTSPWRKAIAFIFDVAGDVLRFVVRNLGRVISWLVNAWVDVFLFVTRPWRRAIRFIAENIGDIFGFVRRNFNRVVNFLVDVGEQVFRTITRPIRRAINLVGDILGGVFGIARDALNGIADFIGDRFGNVTEAISNALSGVADVISGVFEDVLGGIVWMLNKVIDAMNLAIDGWNKVPFHDDVRRIDNIDEPGQRPRQRGVFGGVPVRGGRLQEGGRVGSSYGGGDRIPILAEEGEYMIRKEAVSHWGLSMMEFINRAGGKYFGSTIGDRLQPGGQPRRPGDAEEDQETVREGTRDLLTIITRFGGRVLSEWRDIWTKMERIEKRAMNDIEDDVEKSMRRVVRVIDNSGERMVRSWRRSMRMLQNATYTGLDYISDAAGKALKAFDARVPNITVPRPRSGDERASGGFIGQPGERGRDAIPTWLGRGEAVLNWQHQKVVNSALWNQYGTTLDGLFKHEQGYHAGGPGQGGYASGGYQRSGSVDVLGSKPGFVPLMQYFRYRFGKPLYVMSGSRPGSTVLGSGNVSNHSTGDAIDIGYTGQNPSGPPGMTGTAGTKMDALHSFISRYFPAPPRRDFLWRTFTGGNHYNHIHLGADPSVTGTMALMKAYIAKHFPEGGMFAEIKKVIARGRGPMKEMLQNIFNMVRKAANNFLDKKLGDTGAAGPNVSPAELKEFDHVFDDPNFALSENQVYAIAKSVGLPPRTFTQIARGESGYRPGVISGDGGYGLWQITPRVQGAETLAKIASLGGNRGMLNPVQNALMAKYMFDQAGGRITPWFGTGFVTDMEPPYSAKGGYVGQYARGGELPGGEGRPLPIVAHAGEWILNRSQQARLASWLGTGTGQIKRLLGFTGKAQGGFYQGGGDTDDEDEEPKTFAELLEKLPFRRARRRLRRRGEYELPELTTALLEFGQLIQETKFVGNSIRNLARQFHKDTGGLRRNFDDLTNKELKNLRTKTEEYFEKFNANMNELTKEGGIFDEMIANTERFVEQQETRLLLRRFADPVQLRQRARRVADEDPARAERLRAQARRGVTGRDLDSDIASDAQELARAEQRILRQTTGRLRKLRQALIREYNRVHNQLDAVTDRMRELARGGVEAGAERKEYDILKTQQETLAATEVDLADRRAKAGAAYAENLQARYEAAQEEISRKAQESERLSPADQQATLRRLRQRAGRRGMQELADQIADQISELQISMAATAGEILERTAGLFEARGQGGTSAFEVNAQAQIDAMRTQQAELGRIANNAARRGNARLAQEIRDQIADLDTQIAAAMSAMVQRRLEQVNEAATRQLGRLDLRGRLADVMQAAGFGEAAGGARLGLLQERAGALAGQVGGLQGVLAQAQAIGNVELVKQIEDQLEELNVQLQENTQAQKDQVTAIRQFQLDLISQRGAFRGGLFGQLGQILQTVASATGEQTVQRQIEIATTALAELIGTGALQRQILFETLGFGGIDLRGLSGTAFVDAFQNAMSQFDSILAGLSEAERTQFEALINAIVENEAATQANTASLDELKGTVRDPQSWASSAWQWFREAVFTGMGDVLPQYTVPGLQSGGLITRSGMFNLHAGEFVVNPRHAGGQGIGGDTNITINEAGRPIDVTHLTNRLAFARKNGV